MATSIQAFASGASNLFGGIVDVSTWSPQAGDIYIAIIVSLHTSAGQDDIDNAQNPGWTKHYTTGSNLRSGCVESKLWESGDPTTVRWSTANLKWSWCGVWHVRMSYGRPRFWSAGHTSGASSGTTDSLTLGTAAYGLTKPFMAHANDDKTTAYSQWRLGSTTLTEYAELSEGSGSPSNWSSAGYAAGTTGSVTSTMDATHDDAGVPFIVIGAVFEEQTPVTVEAADPKVLWRPDTHLHQQRESGRLIG